MLSDRAFPKCQHEALLASQCPLEHCMLSDPPLDFEIFSHPLG